MSSESEDGIPAVECAEWTVPKADNAEKVFQGFATTLVQELRKGVIFGDVAATRAEAIRRCSRRSEDAVSTSNNG